MKTVLLVTPNPVHRRLYEPGLAKLFHVEYLAEMTGLASRADAMIYDLGNAEKPPDLRWLNELEIPVVVLTSGNSLRLKTSEKRSYLTYPARMDDILRHLARLGVEGGP